MATAIQYDELGIDREGLRYGWQIWDCIERPSKPVEEYTATEIERECLQLAACYMARQHRVYVEPSQVEGTDLQGVEFGDDVLIRVQASIDLGASFPTLPQVEESDVQDLRWACTQLSQWMECGAGRYRADVVRVTIAGQRRAHFSRVPGVAVVEVS